MLDEFQKNFDSIRVKLYYQENMTVKMRSLS